MSKTDDCRMRARAEQGLAHARHRGFCKMDEKASLFMAIRAVEQASSTVCGNLDAFAAVA
ncbi:hypothetical protein [Lysobacter brunescens]|uniref:Uncharacterized protein n=1 Tax=Lysobacter brunescens TaxID=262323 RepID=A0ABW2YF20_9GAMM